MLIVAVHGDLLENVSLILKKKKSSCSRILKEDSREKYGMDVMDVIRGRKGEGGSSGDLEEKRRKKKKKKRRRKRTEPIVRVEQQIPRR